MAVPVVEPPDNVPVPYFIDVQFDERYGHDFLILRCKGCGAESGLNIDKNVMAESNNPGVMIKDFVKAHKSHEPEHE